MTFADGNVANSYVTEELEQDGPVTPELLAELQEEMAKVIPSSIAKLTVNSITQVEGYQHVD